MVASASDTCGDLFDGGPPSRLESLIGLLTKKRSRTWRIAISVVCVGWLPLILLAAFQTLIFGDGSLTSFLTDYGIHARALLAAPLLTVADAVSVPRLGRIAAQFALNDLIEAEDEPAFLNILSSTRLLRDSLLVEFAVLAVAIASGIALAFFVPPNLLPAWHRLTLSGAAHLSAAGWWNDLVAVPILLVLVLAWIWRLVLWGRFLVLVSRLRLKLVATHPDRVGGLGFLEISLQILSPFGFSLAVILAGSMANRVLHESATIANFPYAIAGFEILLAAAVAGPLLAFTGKLVATWREGILAYGALARAMGARLEKKWLSPRVSDEALQANDFSATTDLFAVVANVYSMKVLPLTLVRIGVFIAATLLPFAPVLLISIPLSFILKKVIGVVF